MASSFDKNNPFAASLIDRWRLSSPASQKDTQHFSVSLAGSGLTYACGDSLGVFPVNNPSAVTGLLKAAGFSGDEPVTLPKDTTSICLREALSKRLALNGPTYKFVQLLHDRTVDEVQKAQLAALLAEADPEKKKAWIEQREYIDLFAEFPAARLQAQELIELMRKLMPRLYSISSAPSKFPNEIHLTIAVVRYETNGRKREGVCSTYLAERARLGQADLPVFVAESHFGLPEDDTVPVIMVGPGTGVAPFRSFVMDRATRGAKGRNWLFFGDQRKEHDFLYADEWAEYLQSGVLTRLDTAFSRDQATKVYVQDRMRENAAELWRWISEGAYFFVCGDAKRMAKDVDAALHTLVAEQGKMTPEAAVDWVKQFKKDGRYQRDVY
ncbi:MAG: sulfite reductase subunit alpha [Verrucomicrobia bacterium]|nr:sulfite reductase subunit alpha [Verrucomicrobiota bacterium]